MYLEDIILALSYQEQTQFISFLEKKNKRKDIKNIQLFRIIASKKLTSNEICKKLYNNNNKDAYHALRKRLYDAIIDFTASLNLEEENSTDMQIIKYILASRTFLIQNNIKVAYKILDKAEKLAEEHFLFAILNEIYHTKIQYAYKNPSLDIDLLFEKFEQNKKQHHLEDQLNIVYAKIRKTLNNITYKGEIIDFETVLNKTLSEHGIRFSDSLSFKSFYQLMTIVNLSAFVTNDYLKTEPFLISTYHTLKKHKTKPNDLFYNIQVIYIIANTLFRNKKFKESLLYLNEMHQLMLVKKHKYYNSFKLKYKLLHALIDNYSNKQDKAIHDLELVSNLKHTDIESILDINLSLAVFYIQKNDFNKAFKLFKKFYHTDKWYTEKAGIEWVIKKNLIEIILHIELCNIDMVESRILSFKRHYFKYLKQINEQRAINYLGFVEHYYKYPESVTSAEFKEKIESSFEWLGEKKEDIFVMSFYAWLKSKIEKKSLYRTTLDLVQKAQDML